MYMWKWPRVVSYYRYRTLINLTRGFFIQQFQMRVNLKILLICIGMHKMEVNAGSSSAGKIQGQVKLMRIRYYVSTFPQLTISNFLCLVAIQIENRIRYLL